MDHPTDRATYRLRRWWVSSSFRFRVVRWAAWILRRAWVSLPEIEATHKRSLGLLVTPESEYSASSKFGDTAVEGEITSWLGYRRGIERGAPGGESPQLYAHVIDRLSEILQDLRPRTFINVGVCYPYIDSVLATRNPSTNFVGVERTDVVPTLNRLFFDDIPNLSFQSGDIFEILRRNRSDFRGGLLFHTRTMTLLSRAFVERLYGAASAAEVSVIVGCEQFGVSRQTGSPYVFSLDKDAPSIIYRKSMFMHNYPGILHGAGYDTVHAEFVRTGHPDADYRIFSFEGRRR